ncbi:ABC transporter permease [Thomasclavelia sp.]|uniref:ABC transporter permease n=1 Tax=Thomasclavelia sp. TaxID=3025757 RepID=UPI0026008C0C|nr:ABC transporter permease [Thomasclavelia sp.]
MKGLLYGIGLQFKMDLRSKSLLITCYVVPLVFFLIMGTIFTSLMPNVKTSLISSMIIMTVTMASLIGVPPSLVEIYGSEIKKMYQVNGISLSFGLLAIMIFAFIHIMIVSIIILILAPVLFAAVIPANIGVYLLKVAFFTIVSLSIAGILGLLIKKQAKLTMISQLIFLPSIMLSGIMFSVTLLPVFLKNIGYFFVATWGNLLLSGENEAFIILLLFLIFTLVIYYFIFKRISRN